MGLKFYIWIHPHQLCLPVVGEGFPDDRMNAVLNLVASLSSPARQNSSQPTRQIQFGYIVLYCFSKALWCKMPYPKCRIQVRDIAWEICLTSRLSSRFDSRWYSARSNYCLQFAQLQKIPNPSSPADFIWQLFNPAACMYSEEWLSLWGFSKYCFLQNFSWVLNR